MPTLPTKSFQTITQDTAVGIQGRAGRLLNFAIGSVLRAIAEGFAGIFLWFQALVLQLLTAIRLNTSSGIDVDTFTADFMPLIPGASSPRLGAQVASGELVFTRLTAGPTQCVVPVGATVQTLEGTQFAVTADPTFPTFEDTFQAYFMAADIATLIVPAAAVVPGSAGNVDANTITEMTSAITGIDQVTNPAAFENGFDQESDAALKTRFAQYILGLSRGDLYGLEAAIAGTNVEVQYAVTEDYNLDGSYRPGYFFIVADDGSGAPSATFLQTVSDAANSVRPLSVQCAVFPPDVINVSVSMIITTAPGFDHNVVVAQVAAGVADGINGLGLGNPLPFSMIATWAYAVPGVTSVSAIRLNGLQGDAASISATKLSNDGQMQIVYATIKCAEVLVS